MKKKKDSFKVWIDKRVNKYQRLKPFKDKPKENILIAIIKSLWTDIEDVKYKLGYLYGAVKSDAEKTFLISRLKAYEEDFTFNQSTDLGDLRQILSFELELKRLQENAAIRDKADLSAIEIMNKLSNTLKELKLKLGISRSQRKSSTEAGVDYITRVKKAAVEYMQKHRNEFMWKCKNCGQIHLLARRHSAFDEQGWIWNVKLITLHNEGKLTLKEVAEILETSEEYIKYICQRKKIELKENKMEDHSGKKEKEG